jgi:hypothetical protein
MFDSPANVTTLGSGEEAENADFRILEGFVFEFYIGGSIVAESV